MSEFEDVKIDLNSETLNVTEEVLRRYNVPGPRYTSYPTAPEWSDTFGPPEFEEALAESNSGPAPAPLSLYMHLPFCERLCLFCGCNVVINRDHEIAPPYIRRVAWEIDRLAARIDRSRPVVQFHWGGGTPTYLTPTQLEDLFGEVKSRFCFARDAELGIEVDPRVTTPVHIEALHRLGFNRISMGIQDFNPAVQKLIRRVQPFDMTRDLFNLCREKGFESVNVDLIYGLPLQTPESFAESVDLVIGMRPDRVAMFSYAHVPWLKKQQGSFAKHIPLGMEKFRIFRTGIERFTRAGYAYVGMDHFAMPDDELCVAQASRTLHRNFQGYTTKAGADLFALGVSSISGFGRYYSQNFRDIKDYATAIDQGRLPTMRGMRLSDEDLLRRAVINRILCHCVLVKEEIETEFGIRFDEHFAPEMEKLQVLANDGLVDVGPDRITVMSLGRIFIRNIGMVFDTYLEKPKDKPVFSKTL